MAQGPHTLGKQLVICRVLGSQSMSPIGLLLYGKMKKIFSRHANLDRSTPHTQTGVKTEEMVQSNHFNYNHLKIICQKMSCYWSE